MDNIYDIIVLNNKLAGGQIVIGLEYILQVTGMEHQKLAQMLGIKKQNINLWIKETQNISKKHLPKLSEIFEMPEEYFQKELSHSDEVAIQESIYLKNALQLEGLSTSKDDAPLALQMPWDDFIDYQKGKYSSLYAEMLKAANDFTKLANLSEASDEKKNEAANYLQFLYTDFIIFVSAIASGESYSDQEVFNILTNSINRFVDAARELNIPYEKMLQDKDD